VTSKDEGTVIDIMIVYTQKVLDKYTDSAPGDLLEAKITESMALLNQAYQNSNIDLTARLVHTALVDYTETGNMGDALDAVTDGNVFTPAPNAVNVHDLRNTYGADFVAMFT
jgi:hypothetical protein